MRNRRTLATALCALLTFAQSAPAALDIPGIEEASRAKGQWIESEKVYRLTFPREIVKVDGVIIPPAAAMSSFASFQSGRIKPAIMMGELVLLADEVNPAIDAALASGIEVTGLHASFFHDEPRVYSLHLTGEGTARGLAEGVRRIVDAVESAQSVTSTPAIAGESAISAAPLDQIFAARGESAAGTYAITVPREVTMPCGCKVGAAMGMATRAAFVGSDERALVIGQFACAYGQLQPVLKKLRDAGVDITAIVNHADAEAPRTLFVHFTATGKATELAKAVKAAINSQPRAGGGIGHHEH